jgi:capsid protein
MLIPQLCQPIWDAFLRAGDLRGVTREDWAVTWTAPRREMIDPLKETEAIQKQIENGLLDWGEAVRQQGYDPDEVMEAIKMYGEKFDIMKIKVAGDFRNTMEMKKKAPSGGQTPAAE